MPSNLANRAVTPFSSATLLRQIHEDQRARRKALEESKPKPWEYRPHEQRRARR